MHEGGADVVREFCSPFFHKLKCYGYGIGNDDDNADTLPTIDEQTIVKSRQCWNHISVQIPQLVDVSRRVIDHTNNRDSEST